MYVCPGPFGDRGLVFWEPFGDRGLVFFVVVASFIVFWAFCLVVV